MEWEKIFIFLTFAPVIGIAVRTFMVKMTLRFLSGIKGFLRTAEKVPENS